MNTKTWEDKCAHIALYLKRQHRKNSAARSFPLNHSASACVFMCVSLFLILLKWRKKIERHRQRMVVLCWCVRCTSSRNPFNFNKYFTDVFYTYTAFIVLLCHNCWWYKSIGSCQTYALVWWTIVVLSVLTHQHHNYRVKHRWYFNKFNYLTKHFLWTQTVLIIMTGKYWQQLILACIVCRWICLICIFSWYHFIYLILFDEA